MNEDIQRSLFEDWIQEEPYQRSVERWQKGADIMWPGQYKQDAVQLAWEAWKKSAEINED